MKKQFKQAYDVLKVMGVPVFTNEDNDKPGNFSINAEDARSADWCDYYGSPQDWDFGVNPAITTVLDQYDLMSEWQNPGCLGVYEA